MLFVSSTLLLLVNAVTLRRVRNLLNRVAILILLFYGIIWCDSYHIALLDTWEGIYGGLFHSTSIAHSFALFLCIIGAIVLQLTAYYPRRSKKSMGAMGKKMSSFLLTKYTDSYFDIYQNNIIKMWEQFRILEFPLIILFILIGGIFLMSSSDLVSMFLSIELQSYGLISVVGKHYNWPKLSNSGNILKLMIPNYNWKIISGWSNFSGKETSHKMSKNEMGYRGSKSDSFSVKEQRVDGSWCIKFWHLRCTLMGFERNYQVRILTKQLINKTYSTLSNKLILNPWFFTGFSDASKKALVVFGSNLTSTVSVKFSRKQLATLRL